MTFDREKYDLLKKHHLCTKCKKQDAYTLMGRVYCYECGEKTKKRKKEWWEKKQKNEAEKALNRYYTLKEQHKCTNCGRKLENDYAYVLCVYCRNKQKRGRKKQPSKHLPLELKNSGEYCWRCAKKKKLYSRRLCEKCYFEQKKYFKPKGKGENPWRKTNNRLFLKNE